MNRNQQLFDEVAVHLMTQMEKSVSQYGTCQYRSHNGKTCAVGCLIDPKRYRRTMEGVAISTDLTEDDSVVRALERSVGFTLTPDHLSLLAELQDIHDTYSPDEWHIELTRLAAGRGLNDDVLGPLADYERLARE
jgi:hypothetical protein